jgi:hypothetical protein
MTCKSYVKRPIVIEALQWDGDLVEGKPEWFTASSALRAIPETKELAVKTNMGEVIAGLGDFIIKSPSGLELYPCKAEVFLTIYEEAPQIRNFGFAAPVAQ